MKNSIKAVYICLISALMLVALLNLDSGASPDGRGDDLREYNCVSSCHYTRSVTAEISIKSTSTSVKAGDEITVVVSISGTEQKPGDPVGVFLLSSLETSSSKPTDSGWEILEDPNGGTNNYVEKPADETGSSEFSWKLKVPETPDKYTLYTREHHGNGVAYFMEATSGLEVEVIDEDAGSGESDKIPDGNTIPEDDKNTDGSVKQDDEHDKEDSGKDASSESLFKSEPSFAPLLLGLIVAGIVVMVTHILRD